MKSKLKSLYVLASVTVIFTPMHTHAQLLKGTVEGLGNTQVTFQYNIDGLFDVKEADTDEHGNFTFDCSEITSPSNISFVVDGKHYAARVEPGKTSAITINGDKYQFSGDNVAANRALTAAENAFEYTQYKHNPTRGEFVLEQYMNTLEKGYAEAVALLSEVEDPALKASLKELFDNRRGYILNTIYSFDQAFNKTDRSTEKKAILDAIDPDSDAAREGWQLSNWFMSLPNDNTGKPFNEMIFSNFEKIDSLLSNPTNKRFLYSSLVDMSLLYAKTPAEVREMKESLAKYLAAEPKLLAKYDTQIAKLESVLGDGADLPCNPTLVHPDGTRTTLKDVIKGKICYIDFWATWCGPCCAMIPHVEKLNEKYKDNEDILFISISCDEDRAAWLSKIDNDKPQWPQYCFESAGNKEFFDALNIVGIPRFIITSADGKIFRTDAPRPNKPENVDNDFKSAKTAI